MPVCFYIYEVCSSAFMRISDVQASLSALETCLKAELHLFIFIT